MKKLLFISLVFIGCTNQLSIPLVAEDISPILIGETLPNANFQNPEGNYVQLKALSRRKTNRFGFLPRRMVSIL